MKTFVCLMAFATAFMHVQKRRQPEVDRLSSANKVKVPEVLLREFCKN
jgi:hypothetical protein